MLNVLSFFFEAQTLKESSQLAVSAAFICSIFSTFPHIIFNIFFMKRHLGQIFRYIYFTVAVVHNMYLTIFDTFHLYTYSRTQQLDKRLNYNQLQLVCVCPALHKRSTLHIQRNQHLNNGPNHLYIHFICCNWNDYIKISAGDLFSKEMHSNSNSHLNLWVGSFKIHLCLCHEGIFICFK